MPFNLTTSLNAHPYPADQVLGPGRRRHGAGGQPHAAILRPQGARVAPEAEADGRDEGAAREPDQAIAIFEALTIALSCVIPP